MKKSATPTVQASGLFHRMFGVWSRRGNSLPVRKLALAVLLLAAAVTSGLYIATVQAGSNGAITGLTLTSDTPGTLTVSWETASPTPTDYRVDWAKSDEDYQSWKVDEGHKYPAPTATTVPPSRTWNTTPSTKSACVLATTEANTKANPGADHGPPPPSQ